MRLREIDFAPRRLRWPLLPTCVALAAVAAGLAGGWHYHATEQVLARARTTLAADERARRTALEAGRVAAQAIDPQRVAAVNTAIAALNVPWPRLLRAVESQRPPDTALVLLEPRPDQGRAAIIVQSASMDSLLAFSVRLAQTSPFHAIQPLRQERAALPDGTEVKRMSFDAWWRAQGHRE